MGTQIMLPRLVASALLPTAVITLRRYVLLNYSLLLLIITINIKTDAYKSDHHRINNVGVSSPIPHAAEYVTGPPPKAVQSMPRCYTCPTKCGKRKHPHPLATRALLIYARIQAERGLRLLCDVPRRLGAEPLPSHV